MSLSIIIAHYAPQVNCEKYFNLLKENINALRYQEFTKDYEIIVCDDGSYWSKNLFKKKNDTLLVLNKNQMSKLAIFDNLHVDMYYGLKDINKYRGVQLKDKAIRMARHNKIIILDDDHHLLKKNELCLFSTYLDKYKYVKGRIIGSDNVPQLFWSRNAQGTTYGFQKDIYINCGGFSKYLFEYGYGEDNDILYKFYKFLTENYKEKVSCFAADICTFDLATNRWLDRSLSLGENEISQQLSSEENYKIFEKKFMNEHGIHHVKGNHSRIRPHWMIIPNVKSILVELIFIVRYCFSFHKVIIKIFKYKLIKIKYFHELFKCKNIHYD